MRNQRLKFSIVKSLMLTVVLICVSAFVALDQYMAGQHVRQFASEAAEALKTRICAAGYSRANPCEGKDVQAEADSGLIAYLYIYGTTEQKTVDELSVDVRTRRNSKPFYNKIPVKVIFYADLQRSSVVRQFWIFGE